MILPTVKNKSILATQPLDDFEDLLNSVDSNMEFSETQVLYLQLDVPLLLESFDDFHFFIMFDKNIPKIMLLKSTYIPF